MRSDAGKLALRRVNVDLAQIVDESVAAAAPAAEQAGVEIVAHAERPLRASVDEARVAQALDNLLSNGIKYSPEGGRVEVSARRRGDEVELVVADNGIGIAESEQEHLFERFFRASGATERGISGTGLGLAIVKEILEAHGGRIACRSASGRGTTFTVCLPAAVARAA